MGTELAWHVADGRLPTADAGALGAVAGVYWSLGTSAGASASAAETLLVPGGWYTWLVAGALRTFGRTPAVFDGVSEAVWIGTVIFTALIARRRSGDRAGAAAALLVAAMPWVTLLARRHGLQAPEAALAVVTFFLVDRDSALARWYTSLPLALVGAALLALGPTAWVWIVALAPLLVFPGAKRHPFRIAVVVTAWVVGAVLGSGNADAVFALAPPERRAAEAVAAFVRGGALLERPVGAAVAIGVLIWGAASVSRLRARRAPDEARRHDLPSRGSTAVLVAWALAPFALGATLRAGPEAWPAGGAALAILVAGPLGRNAGGVLVALLAWTLFVVPQRIDVAPGVWARAILPADATVPTAESPYRPQEADIARTLGALLDATCASDAWASCNIVVDQGLGAPDADDPGRLARFLLAEDRVALSTVYDAPRTRRDDRRVDALLTWDCGVRDDPWRLRAPDAAARVMELAAARQLAAAWSRPLGDPGCVAHWLTPRGIVSRPEALPLADARVAPWTPLATLASIEAFYQRHPSARDRQGRGSAVRPGDAHVATAPDGWTEDGSAWRRGRARDE
ncbi:MAG: hypothetical protein V4850_10415 [Myxococcota bacterium]